MADVRRYSINGGTSLGQTPKLKTALQPEGRIGFHDRMAVVTVDEFDSSRFNRNFLPESSNSLGLYDVTEVRVGDVVEWSGPLDDDAQPVFGVVTRKSDTSMDVRHFDSLEVAFAFAESPEMARPAAQLTL